MVEIPHKAIRKLVISAALLVFSILGGVAGYVLVEDYDMVDALYMTVITISTVGFNEVEPLSSSGKIFATVYILFNIGIFAYIVSTITTYLFEGELHKIFKNIKSIREVKRLKNHVIVCGYGRHGSRACAELVKSRTPYVVIEKDAHEIESSRSADISAIVDDATMDDTLMEAGIERARALITTLPHDADNVFITLTAKELNPAVTIISRASDRVSEKKLIRAGADRVVLPDMLGGAHMAHLITKPYVIEFLEILNGMGDQQLKLEDYTFDQLREQYQYKSLEELDIHNRTGATVVGVKSAGKGFTIGPTNDTVLKERDVIILLGSEESLENFSAYCK